MNMRPETLATPTLDPTGVDPYIKAITANQHPAFFVKPADLSSETFDTRYFNELRTIWNTTPKAYAAQYKIVLDACIEHIQVNERIEVWDDAFDLTVSTLQATSRTEEYCAQPIYDLQVADIYGDVCKSLGVILKQNKKHETSTI